MNFRRVLLGLTAVVVLLGAAVSSAGAFKGFESPSHNIGCVMYETGARCDIQHHSFVEAARSRRSRPSAPTSANASGSGSTTTSETRYSG
jgi:hypothetical protein